MCKHIFLDKMGPWAQGLVGPSALGPSAQGVLMLRTGEAHRPKCVFPLLFVDIVVVVAVVVAVEAKNQRPASLVTGAPN